MRGAPVLIERFRPELIIASGDLSHRGREHQLAGAARFLRSLGPPVLAIPGNHDIPYSFPGRFTRSFREFERQWETTEPTYASPTLHVIGLNSVRPWRHQSGGIRTGQLSAAAERLREGPGSASRAPGDKAKRADCTSTRSRSATCASTHSSGRTATGGSRPSGSSRADVSPLRWNPPKPVRGRRAGL